MSDESLNAEGTAKKIKDIRNMTGLSRADFSKKYGIPINTIRDWEQGLRKCPEYVNNLLERCVIYDNTDSISPEEMTERQRQFYERGQSNLSNFRSDKANGKRHMKVGTITPILIGVFENGIEAIGFVDKRGKCVSIEYLGRGSYNKMISECVDQKGDLL